MLKALAVALLVLSSVAYAAAEAPSVVHIPKTPVIYPYGSYIYEPSDSGVTLAGTVFKLHQVTLNATGGEVRYPVPSTPEQKEMRCQEMEWLAEHAAKWKAAREDIKAASGDMHMRYYNGPIRDEVRQKVLLYVYQSSLTNDQVIKQVGQLCRTNPEFFFGKE